MLLEYPLEITGKILLFPVVFLFSFLFSSILVVAPFFVVLLHFVVRIQFRRVLFHDLLRN